MTEPSRSSPAFLGPLDASGRIPSQQQTRVAAFLISAHGALARQLAFTLPQQMKAAWQTELNAQLYREAEIVSLLLRATSWVVDPAVPILSAGWEAAWLPKPLPGFADWVLGLTIDGAALGHAVHAAIRPAALLPEKGQTDDPFAMALRRIEFESGRTMQAQILFLKRQEFLPFRDAVSAAVEHRHAQVRKLWTEMLAGIGVGEKAVEPSEPPPLTQIKARPATRPKLRAPAQGNMS